MLLALAPAEAGADRQGEDAGGPRQGLRVPIPSHVPPVQGVPAGKGG
jgi:hypothetical protein